MKNKENIKNNKAVALSYKDGDSAPKVIAKGKGQVASNIIEVAEENKVEVYEDKNLVEELMKLDLYEEIPSNLYEAVSKIILFVYHLDKEKGEHYG